MKNKETSIFKMLEIIFFLIMVLIGISFFITRLTSVGPSAGFILLPYALPFLLSCVGLVFLADSTSLLALKIMIFCNSLACLTIFAFLFITGFIFILPINDMILWIGVPFLLSLITITQIFYGLRIEKYA